MKEEEEEEEEEEERKIYQFIIEDALQESSPVPQNDEEERF